MVRKTVKLALMLGVAVLVFASLSLAKTITLKTDVVLPDGQTLKAGVYTVVVDQKVDQVQFLQHSKVVVSHRCKCITEENKNQYDEVLIFEQTGKKPLLQEMRFGGETRIITLPS